MIWDIESYIFKACFACRRPDEIKKNIYVEAYSLEDAIDYIDNSCKRLKKVTGATDVVCVLGDSENNFRKLVDPSYKIHRKPKPLMYDLVLNYVTTKYDCEKLANIEADDTARIIYEDDKVFNCEKVIVSIDKDFKSFPCKLFRDVDENSKIEEITPEIAELCLMKQVIMGDSADGYKGIPGFGEAKTDKWLSEAVRTWKDVRELYTSNGCTPGDFIRNRRLATLVGITSYNFEEGLVRLEVEEDKK